jgi:dolichol-phosphate mannosyltransferase
LGRFLLVGGSGVGVNSAALVAFHQWGGLPLLVATPLAIELAIVSNFVWNDRWTFADRPRSHPLLRRFAQFNLVSVLGLLIATSVTLFLVEEVGLYYLVANLGGIGMATLCNFVVNEKWTWRSGAVQAGSSTGRAAVRPRHLAFGSMVILDALGATTYPSRRTRRKRHDWVRCEVRCLMCGRLLGRLLGTAQARPDGDRSAGEPVALLAFRPIDPPGPIVAYSSSLRFRCNACGGIGAMDDIELFSTYDDVASEDESDTYDDEPVTRVKGRPPRWLGT